MKKSKYLSGFALYWVEFEFTNDGPTKTELELWLENAGIKWQWDIASGYGFHSRHDASQFKLRWC